jgi:anthranilate/para-aminobenzoate synthase component I
MSEMPQVSPLLIHSSPLDLLTRWPADEPLVMLHSGRVHRQWARWSMMASPRLRYQFVNGESRWVGQPPPLLQHVRFVNDPLHDLDAVLNATRLRSTDCSAWPFFGGWIGYLSYDLGRWIEPHAQQAGGAADDRHWPLIDLAWCPEAMFFDHLHRRWFALGEMNTPLAEAESGSYEIGTLTPCMPREHY